MAEQFSMPSMFDTRYAMDRQMELDAQKAGQVGGGGKRYGMYYNSSLLGDRDNASLMSLTGMLGGQGDPRMAKQNAIDTIMQQFPNPESAEDFKAIANALNAQGLYDEAARAMSMANDITASIPKPQLGTVEIPTMKDGVRYTQRWSTKNGVPVEMLGEQPTDAPKTTGKSSYKEVKTVDADGNNIIATYLVGSDGIIAKGATPAFTQLADAPGSISLDDEAYEANLEPYVNEAYQKIVSGTSTTNVMSEEQMRDKARKEGIRAYSKVEDASKNQTDGTAFTKNVGFFLEAKDADGNKLYTLDQAIAKATSLDHQTVSEQDQVTQNAAILEDSQAMSVTEKQAVENERLNNQMLSLLNQIETGKWENVSFKAKQWLGDWDGDLASQEMFFSLATAKVMEYTNMTKGAISDAEMTLFQQAAMSLGKTTEGNRMLLEFAQAGAKATQRMSAHMRAWQLEQKANGRTDVSYAEYETEKARYRNSDENAAYFKAIIDDDWANAVDIGNSIETIGNLEEASQDGNTALGAYCANPANKGSSTYNNFCS